LISADPFSLRDLPSDRQAAPYLPFTAPYRMAMGVSALDPDSWIELDRDYAETLALKRTLLATRHEAVFAALPDAAAASEELLATLTAHLLRRFPQLFERRADRVLNKLTDEAWDVAHPTLHPLELAGRLVQEDFCLLLPDATTHRLAAASLCFPSRWHLSEKLGHPLSAIHGPVPLYAERLGSPVDGFLARLQPHNPVWRLNWMVHDDPSLFQPVRSPSPEPITRENAGELLWLRVERQTLRRLPQSAAVIFTIRTHLTPLAAAIATRQAAAELAATIRSMPPEIRAYRQMDGFEPALFDWLADRAVSV
jgi:hypothetical protein